MLGQILHDIRADLYRYTGKSDAVSGLKAFASIPGFRWGTAFRAASRLRRGGALSRTAYLFSAVALRRYRFAFGFDIPASTRIGPGLFLGHFGGVVINSSAVIGANCNIAHGVTIGRVNRGARTGVPTIGDRVWIGPHAIIVGGIQVGDDALIAPGAYVNFDVAPGSVVVGNPGKVVSMRGAGGYVNRQWPPAGASPGQPDHSEAHPPDEG